MRAPQWVQCVFSSEKMPPALSCPWCWAMTADACGSSCAAGVVIPTHHAHRSAGKVSRRTLEWPMKCLRSIAAWFGKFGALRGELLYSLDDQQCGQTCTNAQLACMIRLQKSCPAAILPALDMLPSKPAAFRQSHAAWEPKRESPVWPPRWCASHDISQQST